MVKDSDSGPVLVPDFYCINQRKYITYSENPLKSTTIIIPLYMWKLGLARLSNFSKAVAGVQTQTSGLTVSHEIILAITFIDHSAVEELADASRWLAIQRTRLW